MLLQKEDSLPQIPPSFPNAPDNETEKMQTDSSCRQQKAIAGRRHQPYATTVVFWSRDVV